MRFLAVMKGDADTEARKPPSPELMARMDSFMTEVAKAGVLISSEGLHPSANAFNLTLANGKLTVTDGPFPETKEVLASYALFDVKSKEEAIEWTSRFLDVLGQGNVDIYPIFEYTEADFAAPANT